MFDTDNASVRQYWIAKRPLRHSLYKIRVGTPEWCHIEGNNAPMSLEVACNRGACMIQVALVNQHAVLAAYNRYRRRARSTPGNVVRRLFFTGVHGGGEPGL